MNSRPDEAVRANDYRSEFAHALHEFDQRPKLVVDFDQRALWCCEDTNRMLDAGMPLRIRNGRLVVEDEEERAALAEMIHAAGSKAQRKLLRGKNKQHWAMLRVWKPEGWKDSVCILCSLSLPTTDVEKSGLARELKLTRAETRVLRAFAELNSPKQIATKLGVSLSTVRSHLKQIHAKASVNSSLHLLRLAHTFCST